MSRLSLDAGWLRHTTSTSMSTHHKDKLTQPMHNNSSTDADSELEGSKKRVGDYILLEKIGQGSFATVFKAQHKRTKRIVAVKAVSRSKLTKKLLENLESEISILKAIRHDHIVGLIECQKTETDIYLVMEYCSMGDLSQYIKRKRLSKSPKGPPGGLPERTARQFLVQLTSALKFLRAHNLVHRDIKPQNLLLVAPENQESEDDLPILKIADFGFARFLPSTSMADTLCGSPLYMGPEILSYKKYDAKADLWSVGTVLYEMLIGWPPFRAQNHIDLLKQIEAAGDRIQFPDEVPGKDSLVVASDLKDIIRKLLKKNPVERISFEEFFIHPATTLDAPGYSPSPVRSNSMSNAKSQRSPDHTSRSTRPLSANASYEPPPFAQSPSAQRQRLIAKAGRTRQESERTQSLTRQKHSPEDKPTKAATTKFNSNFVGADTQDVIKRNLRGGGEIDDKVLQEYVVLDRRIIETNQFADEIDASPRGDRATRQNLVPQYGWHESSGGPSSAPFAITRERKISEGSACSQLAKALSAAKGRLFGAGNSPPKFSNFQQSLVSSPRGFMLTGRDDPHESKTIKTIERSACMAHAVARFADSKFEVLYSGQCPNETQAAEEAMVLYIKALALLELGMDTARYYWSQLTDEQVQAVSVRLNDAVQWMRERFNECLDRASFAGSKCDRDDQNSSDTLVEKLLYDKALEMSRAAAVLELVGENIAHCEHDYQTAIWMLEAILEVRSSDDVDIEEEDRQIINKFINSIKHRISSLRRKKEMDAKQNHFHQTDEARIVGTSM